MFGREEAVEEWFCLNICDPWDVLESGSIWRCKLSGACGMEGVFINWFTESSLLMLWEVSASPVIRLTDELVFPPFSSFKTLTIFGLPFIPRGCSCCYLLDVLWVASIILKGATVATTFVFSNSLGVESCERLTGFSIAWGLMPNYFWLLLPLWTCFPECSLLEMCV